MSHLFKSFVARKMQDAKFQARVSESFLKEVVLTNDFQFYAREGVSAVLHSAKFMK